MEERVVLTPKKFVSYKNPIDGFIKFTTKMEVADLGFFRASIFSDSVFENSGREIVSGYFDGKTFSQGLYVPVKISGESEDLYQVYFVSNSKNHGFVSGIYVWIPKKFIWVVTQKIFNTFSGTDDERFFPMRCKNCRDFLVMANGVSSSLVVCPACKIVEID